MATRLDQERSAALDLHGSQALCNAGVMGHAMWRRGTRFNRIPDEVLQRNSQRFAYLVQQGIVYGFHSDESAETRVTRATRNIIAYGKESGGVVFADRGYMHLHG